LCHIWGYAILFGGILPKIYPQIPLDLDKHIAQDWTNSNKKPAISNGLFTLLDFVGLVLGGDGGDRTPGLYIANVPLSHLSYIPTKIRVQVSRGQRLQAKSLKLKPLNPEPLETFFVSLYTIAK
jgi:hypothetical protein